jgi:UDP-glucose 6-dehydrogenase
MVKTQHWSQSLCCIMTSSLLLLNSATQLVLRAHKEAVNSLAGNGSPATLGTVATAVANANATAMEATKEIEAALKVSMRAALGLGTNNSNEGQLDDLTIMKVCIHLLMIFNSFLFKSTVVEVFKINFK